MFPGVESFCWEFKIEVEVDVDAIMVLIWSALVELDFFTGLSIEDVSCCVILSKTSSVFFPEESVRIRSVRILDSIVCFKALIWLFCPAGRLGMPSWLYLLARRQSSMTLHLSLAHWRAQRSWSTDPGRMLDTLLPIPDAEYPAFYPISI